MRYILLLAICAVWFPTGWVGDDTDPDDVKPAAEPVQATDEPERIQLFEKTLAKSDGGPLELTFDDLSFEMQPDEKFDRSMLTDQINSYHDQTIRLRGFIRPSFRQDGITKFVFVRDNKECCFGPGAALYDCVLVKLAKGKETEFTVRPIVVEGNFYLKEYRGPDGKVWSIYRIKNGRID